MSFKSVIDVLSYIALSLGLVACILVSVLGCLVMVKAMINFLRKGDL